MSLLPGDLRSKHRRPRWPSDFYVEPAWCAEALFATVPFEGPIHDPACGSGRIVEAARRTGYTATGADIVDRGFADAEIIDFLCDHRPRTTVIFNAPYEKNEDFIEHGLGVASHAVAAFVRITFVCGQKRYTQLYERSPPALILPFARRPSCPPGGTDIPAKGGTADCGWFVWKQGHTGETLIRWLPPSFRIRQQEA